MRTASSFFALLLVVFPLAVGHPGGQAWANSRCISDTQRGLEQAARRIELLQRFHVRKSETRPGWQEVLIPQPDGSFVVRALPDSDVPKALSAIGRPIDLEALITSYAPGAREVGELLERVSVRFRPVRTSLRLKDVDRLKDKIFSRAIKLGPRFTLTSVDDVIGGRIIVRLPKERSTIAAAIVQHQGLVGRAAKTETREQSAAGYRALHVTIETSRGTPAEIQIMTQRMVRWSDWNHDRVYKPRPGEAPQYLQRLRRYDQAIIRYINELDDGVPHTGPRPTGEAFGIRPEDHFPDAWLY